ncbi:MAG TPA: acyl-ACP thioesterase domain-containing protein [Acidimicrobiales bacterium]|nr:acyl-ACP thioesterase domain-containing protein [Acidimicrobiales bacterium]
MEDDPLAIEPPPAGRVHGHRRRIQFADVAPSGRLRLDAAARMLQDVSDEDTTDAGFPPAEPWVVRRAEVLVHAYPSFRDEVDLRTWCSGTGARWAERRVRIAGAEGEGRIEAAVLWVHLDADGRPARLPDRFEPLYGEAARGRKVRARLHHDPLPPAGTPTTPFPLRATDFDLLDHVNNAVSWEPVEEALAARPALQAPLRASVEHPASIDRGAEPEVAVVDRDGGFDLWVLVDGVACSTARVRPAG